MAVDEATLTAVMVYDGPRRPGRAKLIKEVIEVDDRDKCKRGRPRTYTPEEYKAKYLLYNRQYYHEHKGTLRHQALCPLCNKLFMDRPSVNRHMKNNCSVMKQNKLNITTIFDTSSLSALD
jgi:hypothetical protein